MSESDAPVRDTLAAMTEASIENSDLSAREHMIARIAALIAVDAPAASYALNVEVAADSGVTLDDVEDILVAVAPIVGAPRVGSAVIRLAEGLGFVIEAALEAEAEADAEAAEEIG
jgi:alkylhydroperoxidase/carboxymuconolactone decarboxylase family protein YurZ